MSGEKRSRLGPGTKPPIDPGALDKFAAGALTVPEAIEETSPEISINSEEPRTPTSSIPLNVYPWDAPHVRTDVKKQVLLRISEPLYLKLAWLAQKSPSKYTSMNQIISDGTEQLVEEELQKLIG
ncbi:MAG: hypothetical protein A2511_16635 [Deltaproteobacteria bacterium RIFOXYD12_FULL_50_9]|nr:MAG: hypothetical protein A2511_16635 [Deltaproteobacteria bacterium RIFOXYD12_FULL_50_9]